MKDERADEVATAAISAPPAEISAPSVSAEAAPVANAAPLPLFDGNGPTPPGLLSKKNE